MAEFLGGDDVLVLKLDATASQLGAEQDYYVLPRLITLQWGYAAQVLNPSSEWWWK